MPLAATVAGRCACAIVDDLCRRDGNCRRSPGRLHVYSVATRRTNSPAAVKARPGARDPFLKRCHPRNSRPLRRRPTRPISDRPPYPLETTTEFSRGGQVRPRLTRLLYLLSRTSQLHAASGSLDFLVDFSVLLLLLVTVSSHRPLAATVFMFYYFIY